MATESRLARLAAVAREVGATVYHVLPKHARNGAHLRLRIPDVDAARRLNREAWRLGFTTGGVLHEGGGTCQLVIQVPTGDMVELRHAIGVEALPRPVQELAP